MEVIKEFCKLRDDGTQSKHYYTVVILGAAVNQTDRFVQGTPILQWNQNLS